MKALVESLSLGSGAVLVAILSAVIVWLLCSLCLESLRKVWVVIVPFALAYCLYWSPTWLTDGSEFDRALIRSEYHTWALLFILAACDYCFASLIPPMNYAGESVLATRSGRVLEASADVIMYGGTKEQSPWIQMFLS